MHELQIPRYLNFISEILHLLANSNHHERIFHLVVDRVVRLYSCQNCAIVLINRKTEYLSVENSYGLSWAFCNDFRRRVATGAIGRLLWTGAPVVIVDSAKEPVLSKEVMLEHPFGSCICVPLSVDHQARGYLYADSREAGVFGEHDLAPVQLFADLAALALQKGEMFEENLRLDRIDHEVELEKYAAFRERLNIGMEMAHGSDNPLAVIILDVDNYKDTANTYGAEAASLFLKQLGGIVSRRLRATDAAGRYGPDEIVIMLVRTGMNEALTFARDLKDEVASTSFTSSAVRATVSMGVAVFPTNGKTSNELLQSAKSALFEAQRAGRNKVFHYESAWGDPASRLQEMETR